MRRKIAIGYLSGAVLAVIYLTWPESLAVVAIAGILVSLAWAVKVAIDG